MVSFICIRTTGINKEFSVFVTEFWPCRVIRQTVLNKVRFSWRLPEPSLADTITSKWSDRVRLFLQKLSTVTLPE